MHITNRRPSRLTAIGAAVAIGIIATILTLASHASTPKSMGDLNSSGKVDILDLSILLSHFNTIDVAADVNSDGKVNILDLSIFLSNFGKSVTVTPATPPLLEEEFSSGLSTTKWYAISCAHPDGSNGIDIVNDPVRTGGKSARFLVNENDTATGCTATAGMHGSTNVRARAQLESFPTVSFKEGDDFYTNVGTLFPTGFPSFNGKGEYVQFLEIYGAPFKMAPTIALNVVNNSAKGYNDIELQGSASTTPGDVVTYWKQNAPLTLNKWEQFTLHVKLSSNPADGYVELWYNGKPQSLSNGQSRVTMQTLYNGYTWNGSNSTNSVIINSYRSGSLTKKSGDTYVPVNLPGGNVTLYHDDIRIGKTYESVQPK